MSYVCPGNPGYPTKPGYSTFADMYSIYAQEAATMIHVSIAFVMCQWYQEWGIPIYNPAFQRSTMGYSTQGYCGSFPVFATMEDGTSAYASQINYSYNGGPNAFTDVFGQTVNIHNAYLYGYPGGLNASVKTDDNKTVTATSQHFLGELDGSGLTGTYAANEAMGASPWDAGHYMLSADTYPGRRLNIILNDSGWDPKYT